MPESLNFSNEYFKNLAINKIETKYENNFTASDAFMLCIKDIDIENLDNLCTYIQNFYSQQGIIISKEDCYMLTQGQTVTIKPEKQIQIFEEQITLTEDLKQIILELAYQCISDGHHLGNKMSGKFNTSAWLSHSLYQGETAALLASQLNLKPDTARKLGILHDIGRKKTHKFDHTIQGFELLAQENLLDEAICCLTHSFIANDKLHGNRCANCDAALPGFYVDNNGKPNWDETTEKDDITYFLESHNYNLYDFIINIADLMATDKGITSPYERVADIATRKPIDPKNRKFFLASLINLLNTLMNINQEQIKATDNISEEEMNQLFQKTSENFYNYFLELRSKNNSQKLGF